MSEALEIENLSPEALDPLAEFHDVLWWLELPEGRQPFPELIPEDAAARLEALYGVAPEQGAAPDVLVRQVREHINRMKDPDAQRDVRLFVSGFCESYLPDIAPGLYQGSLKRLKDIIRRHRADFAERPVSIVPVVDALGEVALETPEPISDVTVLSVAPIVDVVKEPDIVEQLASVSPINADIPEEFLQASRPEVELAVDEPVIIETPAPEPAQQLHQPGPSIRPENVSTDGALDVSDIAELTGLTPKQVRRRIADISKKLGNPRELQPINRPRSNGQITAHYRTSGSRLILEDIESASQ